MWSFIYIYRVKKRKEGKKEMGMETVKGCKMTFKGDKKQLQSSELGLGVTKTKELKEKSHSKHIGIEMLDN